MKIPKRLKIGGIDYKVQFPKRKMRSKDGVGYSDGITNVDNQWIKFFFEKGVGKQYKELIFLHELTHLLFYYTGTGNWKCEQEVHAFASFLYQVLKDNDLLK